jgi:hypothetical protein
MDDHSQRHLPHPSSRLDHPPHHPHFQAHYRHQQDIHGPLSAGVVEGRRAFPFHSSLRSTPLSFSTPAPPSANLSVADILDKYQDANSDFLVSILNAKAKEDEVRSLPPASFFFPSSFFQQQRRVTVIVDHNASIPCSGYYHFVLPLLVYF